MWAIVLNEMLEVWPPIPATLGSDWKSIMHRQWKIHEPAVQVVGMVKISHVVSILCRISQL